MSLRDHRIDRSYLVEALSSMILDWGDEEDAVDVIDVLLLGFEPVAAWTWMMFRCDYLDGIPLDLIYQGRARDVIIHARWMVGQLDPVRGGEAG